MFFNIELLGDHLVDRNFLSLDNEVIEACVTVSYTHLLIELGAQGVAIEDSMDYVGNVDRFGEIFPEVEQQEEIVVTAYYPETVDVVAVEADLQYRLAELTDFMDLGEVKIGTTALAEEDWADNWKKYYEPARITHDLTIVPSWTDYEATAGEKIIKLDPGMAFGTGTHPTTKMSLFALEQVLRGGETCLLYTSRCV